MSEADAACQCAGGTGFWTIKDNEGQKLFLRQTAQIRVR
jgi:hypothetical protein